MSPAVKKKKPVQARETVVSGTYRFHRLMCAKLLFSISTDGSNDFRGEAIIRDLDQQIGGRTERGGVGSFPLRIFPFGPNLVTGTLSCRESWKI